VDYHPRSKVTADNSSQDSGRFSQKWCRKEKRRWRNRI